MNTLILGEKEFHVFQKFIFQETGISLTEAKKGLVQSRLAKRLHEKNIDNFVEYLRLVQIDHIEKIEMINQITTNETYFFREQKHFDFLASYAKKLPLNERLRVWSAASSVGAEAYSLAMLLDDLLLSSQWEVLGTDINTEVIKKARMGLYPESWIDKIPQAYRQKYCLKGKGRYEGQFLIDRKIVPNIRFQTGNLLEHQREVGLFDVIFLRNVLIYFNEETRRLVVENVTANLKKGGYFIISLTEHLQNLDIAYLKKIDSSIYQKV